MSKPKKPRRSKTGRPWSLAQSPQLQEVQLNITEPSLSSENEKTKHVMILGWYCEDIVMILWWLWCQILSNMSKSCEVERVTNLALSRASSARLCSSVWFVRCVRVYASSVNQPPLHSNIPASTILHHVLQILRSFYCPHCRMPLEETQTCHRVPSRSWKGSKGSKENRQNRLLTSLDMWP